MANENKHTTEEVLEMLQKLKDSYSQEQEEMSKEVPAEETPVFAEEQVAIEPEIIEAETAMSEKKPEMFEEEIQTFEEKPVTPDAETTTLEIDATKREIENTKRELEATKRETEIETPAVEAETPSETAPRHADGRKVGEDTMTFILENFRMADGKPERKNPLDEANAQSKASEETPKETLKETPQEKTEPLYVPLLTLENTLEKVPTVRDISVMDEEQATQTNEPFLSNMTEVGEPVYLGSLHETEDLQENSHQENQVLGREDDSAMSTTVVFKMPENDENIETGESSEPSGPSVLTAEMSKKTPAEESKGGIKTEEDDTSFSVANEENTETFYTSRDDNNDFLRAYRKKSRFFVFRMTSILVLFAGLLFLEWQTKLPFSLPWFLTGERTPIVMMLIHLQLLILVVICGMPELVRGCLALKKGLFTPNMVALLSFLFVFAYDGLLLGLGVLRPQVFATPFVLYLFFIVLSAFYRLHAEAVTFKALAYHGDRLVLSPSGKNEDGTEMLRMRKLAFVEGFSTNLFEEKTHRRFMPFGIISLVIALLAGGYIYYLEKEITTASLAFLFVYAMLSTVFFIFECSYAVYRFAKACSAKSSAVLGPDNAMQYIQTSEIAFEDVAAFPANKLGIARMKIYDKTKLEEILSHIASVYRVVGGPLQAKFGEITADFGDISQAEIKTITEQGIDANVGGIDVTIGLGTYLMEKGIKLHYDADDETYLSVGNMTMLFIAEDQKIKAKLYLSYAVAEEFLRITEALATVGIHTAIRTFDPNINRSLLLKGSLLPQGGVSVQHKTLEQTNDFASVRGEGAIVTADSSHTLLTVFFACMRLSQNFAWLRISSYVFFALVAIATGVLVYFLPKAAEISLVPLLVMLLQMPLIAIFSGKDASYFPLPKELKGKNK